MHYYTLLEDRKPLEITSKLLKAASQKNLAHNHNLTRIVSVSKNSQFNVQEYVISKPWFVTTLVSTYFALVKTGFQYALLLYRNFNCFFTWAKAKDTLIRDVIRPTYCTHFSHGSGLIPNSRTTKHDRASWSIDSDVASM